MKKASELTRLLILLTKDEFRLLFALDFLHESEEYREVVHTHTRETPGVPPDDLGNYPWVEKLLRAARWLALDHGFKFKHIEFTEEGAFGDPEYCDESMVQYEIALAGQCVDFEGALIGAIRCADAADIDTLPMEALRDALAGVRSSIGEVERKAAERPDLMKQYDDARDKELAKINVIRSQKGGVVN